MQLISFCINTTKHEYNHLSLLMNSLICNLSHNKHEILIFIENDSDDLKITNYLKTIRHSFFPNLTIIRNTLPIPIGYARNINIMFERAQHEIVSYLQSDMVICPNYDVEILKHLSPNTIISSTRIEPPLHPSSPEKITHNFGLDPNQFLIDQFNIFSNLCKKEKITDYWFAPFTLYKSVWTSIGGHDTLFRRSREDSDILYRLSIKGIKTKQTWLANVYHFTCTSSRGLEWWKNENATTRGQLQQLADQIEITRFLYKWPTFKHTSEYNPELEYKYPTSINITEECNAQLLFQNYWRFNKIFVPYLDVREKLKQEFDKLHSIANQLLNITPEQWELYKKYYRTISSQDIFVNSEIKDENVILTIPSFDNNLLSDQSFINLNHVIHQSKEYGEGSYELYNGILTINKFDNKIEQNVIVKNPSIDDIQFIIE